MATEWIGFADALLHGLGLMREARLRRDDRADQALTAVYTAANETHRYIYALQRGLAPDRNREHDLAHLWQMASIPLRYFDADLAAARSRCKVLGRL